MKKKKIFCIPFAGGTCDVYNPWKKLLSHSYEVIPIELSGHGVRIFSKLYRDFNEGVEDVYTIIEKQLNKDEEYYIFGHSMGVILAFETVKKLIRNGYKPPVYFYASGCNEPGSIKDVYEDLTNEEWIEKIKEFGGTPDEILQNNEILDIYLPIIKSDFKLLSEYKYRMEKEKVNSNLIILMGREDKAIKFNNVHKWADYFTGKYECFTYSGGHFFIKEHMSEICQLILQKYSEKA